jgi:predicted nucleic acid-binding protein
MLVYCDTVILIYYFDFVGPFQVRAANRLAALGPGDRLAVSDLVRLEYRVGPMAAGDPARLNAFDAFCSRPDAILVPITTAVFDRATAIRAVHKFRLGDSIHLAAAVEAGCDLFLTNDHRLSAFPDIPVEVLP